MGRRVYRYAGRDWPDPRDTRAWRALRDRVVSEEPTCRLRIVGVCTTVSTTADHIIPVPERPDLAMERTNHRGACASCNRARSNLPDSALVKDSARPAPALEIFRC
ncbi:5-methylcytosine-specific restriction endonuclease McrA [Nocardioides soli]|uniref:5-methylcytosine-specific restriction endonuclease McrA n=1 Tax=Nocardioides soli TaxID=1036020 RepID=A0A7W4VTC0_9ACTN|nr:5-methylcytosine-specific restriction endonuclease McrA [Nocardioides soli]